MHLDKWREDLGGPWSRAYLPVVYDDTHFWLTLRCHEDALWELYVSKRDTRGFPGSFVSGDIFLEEGIVFEEDELVLAEAAAMDVVQSWFNDPLNWARIRHELDQSQFVRHAGPC